MESSIQATLHLTRFRSPWPHWISQTVPELVSLIDAGAFRLNVSTRLETIREVLVDAVAKVKRAITDSNSAWELFARSFDGPTAHELLKALLEQTALDESWTRLLEMSPTVVLDSSSETLVCPEYNDDGRVFSLEARLEGMLSKLLGRLSNLNCAAASITHAAQHSKESDADALL